jgi:hypothetical protein
MSDDPPTDEAEVLFANGAFYNAFAARDPDAMDDLWAKTAPVACIHPGWNVLQGREHVMDSWRAILSNPEAPQVICSEARAHVIGAFAYVTCEESVSGARLAATNIFIREQSEWRLIHHQAGPIAMPPIQSAPPPPKDQLN